jgi:4-amino-4-deoxy-L-arabinose transferase-like glycosyltransferase
MMLNIKNINKEIIVKIILFLLLTYPPIFLHLGSLPIRIWDESRLAINAYEMNKDGDFLVTHFSGMPDMWNTKPPLMIWLQVFFIKLFGVGELALRLPSAIAAFLTCVFILFLPRWRANVV